MANYASAKAASEIRGGHYRIGATITPIDPDSHAPTNVTLRGPGSNVLAVTDSEAWQYDSHDDIYWFEPLVESFGDISCAAEIHSAFQTLADPRLVLRDVRINGVLDNGQLTFASGSPGESPALTGDEVRLSQLLQYYVWQGAAVEYKVYYFAGPDTNDTTTYKTQTIFKGTVESIDLPPGQIVFNLTQPTKAEDTLIPKRRITDPPDPNAKGQFIPIVYGRFTPSAYVNGIVWYDAIAAGFHPALSPILSWMRDAATGSKDCWLAIADFMGINTGWETQTIFTSGLKSSSADIPLVYFPEADAWGRIIEGASVGQTKIYCTTDVPSGDAYELFGIVKEYQTVDLYIPCDGIYEDTHSLVDSPADLLKRSPHTFANVLCDDTTNGWSVQFTVSPISIMGEIPLIADCIGAYVMIGARGNFVGSPAIRFGIYSVASADWVGGYVSNVFGALDSTDLKTAALHLQVNKNSAAVPTSAYIQPSGAQQPIMRADWRYVHNSNPVTEGPMTVKLLVSTAGGAADTFELISVGVVCRVKLKTGGGSMPPTTFIDAIKYGTDWKR